MAAHPGDRPEVRIWPPPQTITFDQLHALLDALADRIALVLATHLDEDQAVALLHAMAAEVQALLAQLTHPER